MTTMTTARPAPLGAGSPGRRHARRSGAAPLKDNHYRLLQLVLFWAGAILLPLGLVVIMLGWYGAANTPYQYDQLSYLVSGGLLGLGLTFCGGFLYFGAWLARIAADQRESAKRLADTLLVLADVTSRSRRPRHRDDGVDVSALPGDRRRRHHHAPPRLRADRPPRRPAPGRRGQRPPHPVPGLPALTSDVPSAVGCRRSGDAPASVAARFLGLLGQHVVDVVARGLEDVDLVAGALGEVPPVHEDLVEDLGRLELAARLGRHHRDDRLVDLGQPLVRDQRAVLAAEVVVGGERRDVVEQPPGLGVLDVEPGERLQLALVVAELDDLGLDPHLVAVEVGDDVELVDVEAEVVEPLDPLLDPPHLVGRELLLGGQLGPQRVVPLVRAARRSRAPAPRSSSESLAWRSSSSAKTFSQPTVMSYSRMLVGQAGLELAGLGVDEVRREPAGAAAEQHVGQRHVAPVEVGQVQPDQQHDQRVDQRGQVVGGQAVREEAAVGQREAQVLGQQRGRQLLAVLVDPAGDHALRHAPPAGRSAAGRAAGGTRGTRSPRRSP